MDGDGMRASTARADLLASDCDRLQDIDRIVAERCGPEQVQDIVGNLLLMLQSIEAGAGTRQGLAADEVGGLQAAMEQEFGHLDLLWLPSEDGSDCVCVVRADRLRAAAPRSSRARGRRQKA